MNHVKWARDESGRLKSYITCIGLLYLILIQTGCKSLSEIRGMTDTAARSIIEEKQKEVLGQKGDFSIERPINILRRRLLLDQNLPISCEASIGVDRLKPIPHWPEKDYPYSMKMMDANHIMESDEKGLRLSLIQALQVGAQNYSDYQDKKEEIFRAALNLDLERDEFRNTFNGQIKNLLSTDTSTGKRIDGIEDSGSFDVARRLQGGTKLMTALAVDLANLLTLGGASAFGIMADASITIPLLRGSGEHIVTEPLKQAEQDVIYAIYAFERFKQTYAVEIVKEYLSVLRDLDAMRNAKENYRSLNESAKRVRRLADAGRLTEIEVDQAVQNELKARNHLIMAIGTYNDHLDEFKVLLGLPPDAKCSLDDNELGGLVSSILEISDYVDTNDFDMMPGEEPCGTSPTNAPVFIFSTQKGKKQISEITESLAIRLALKRRPDLLIAQGKVNDTQRKVIVLADRLGAELTFLGETTIGERRSIESADIDDASLRTDRGISSALLTLDLPFNRTAERIDYRDGFIRLEMAVRDLQKLEDQIKLSIRSKLRDICRLWEDIKIQSKAVSLAEKRVKSINMFLDAGRAEVRDLLDAQDALLSAKNNLTSAVINYRIAVHELQSDLGVLEIDKKGISQELSIEDMLYEKTE